MPTDRSFARTVARAVLLATLAFSLVAASAADAGPPAPPPPKQALAAATWISDRCIIPGGAITVRPGGTFVSGYFGNLTALGLLATGIYPELVRSWMDWYIAHAHDSVSGLDGVPDDATLYPNGIVASRTRPDSTDAYGATLLSLARAAYDGGVPSLHEFLGEHRADLVRIATSVLATQQSSGLTWSRPQHQIAYAFDNAQVYAGLLDGAYLFREAFGDDAFAAQLDGAAARVRSGMFSVLWDPASQSFRPYVGVHEAARYPAADFTKVYPDAIAEVMMVVYGVVPANSTLATSLVRRAAPALLADGGLSALEDRAALRIALRAIGAPQPPLADFAPPSLCVDAGWYLVDATERWQP